MKTFYNFFFSIGSLCGIAALLLSVFRIPTKEIISLNNIDYIYDKLSFHMFYLEAILVIVGLAAAALGIVGYQSIKDEAVRQATGQAVSQAVEQAVSQAVEKARDEARAYFQTSGSPAEWDIPSESPRSGSSKSKVETHLEEEESK